MDDWQPKPTRVVAAAEFVGRFLTVRVAQTVRGSAQGITMKVTPQARPDIAKWSYAMWDSAQRIPVPAGWNAPVDPWAACAYSGSSKGSAASPAELGRIAGDPSAAASRAQLVTLIDEHLEASGLDDGARANLREFLEADFEDLHTTVLVSGDTAADTDDLTLAAAQELHDVVAAGDQLTGQQQKHAEILLRDAPWQYGYWGAFKAVVKAVPVDHLSEAYAIAVARLSRADPTSLEPVPGRYEDLEVLAHLFVPPSKKTRAYLARRVRRDLATLAKQAPDAYARVASQMLIAWDEPLSCRAYAPAYVMLGAESPLDARSDYVRADIDMGVRRDPHPDIWNQRADHARSVFASIRSSVEALTWSFQVLEAADMAVPPVAGAIGLALESTYPALRRAGSAALTEHPDVFDTVTASQWVAFFTGATDDEAASAADALARLEVLPSAVTSALIDILVGSDDISDRRARIGVLYLAAQKKRSSQRTDADVAALIVVIAMYQLQHEADWGPVSDRLRPQDLLTVYRSLVFGSSNESALDAIRGAILKKHWMAADLALECLSVEHEKMVGLGWRLIDAQGGAAFLFERVLTRSWRAGQLDDSALRRLLVRVLPRAETSQQVAKAAEWALYLGFDPSELAGMLAECETGRVALWEMVNGGTNGATKELAYATADVIRAVGETPDAQQLSSAAIPQLTFVLRYIRDNPSKIADDPSFGLAALETSDASLQTEALRQLSSAGHLPDVWLALAESENPAAVEAARSYIASLTDKSQIRDAVLSCVQSEVPAVQDLGLTSFQARQPQIDDPAVWSALAELDDYRAQVWVAEGAAAGDQIEESTLISFDRRILTGPRRGSRARSLVKQRLQSASGAIKASTDERILTLLELARGPVADDREWALMRLASLALDGIHIDGLEVSLTTEGTVTAGDIS